MALLSPWHPGATLRRIMLYHAFEFTHAALAPMRALCQAEKLLTETGINALAQTPQGRALHAALQVFDGMTHRYPRPEWGIETIMVNGETVTVDPTIVDTAPFCELLHFTKDPAAVPPGSQPKVLIVMPLSGHYPALLRGTVEAMLGEFDVYVTDWRDARMVPAFVGPFGLDEFIDTVIRALHVIGPDTHLLAVSQSSVPVLAAVSLLATSDNPNQPASMVLMGGPIDARVNPSAANEMAACQDRAWLEQTAISHVPWPHPGAWRPVCPGFLTLSGFLFKNLERHVDAQLIYFNHLVDGDGGTAAEHRTFYEKFLAVMDLPTEVFLDTVETVFQTFNLPRGRMHHRGTPITPLAIHHTALMTVEGGRDDICPPGQTAVAHGLCPNIAKKHQRHLVHPDVGHFGVFNGQRWRHDIQPEIAAFIHSR